MHVLAHRWLALALTGIVGMAQAQSPVTYTYRPREMDSLGQLPSLPPAATTDLVTIERALRPLAQYVLGGQDVALKLEANQQLQTYLTAVLSRPESYAYPFDSLRTVSIVAPADGSFRVFTWQMTDPSGNHQYNGIVQRRFQPNPKAKDPMVGATIVAIPLTDATDRTKDVERISLTPDRWFGALYYKPRLSQHGVLSYDGSFSRYNSITGKPTKEKTRYYVLLGYNGHTTTSNYKVIEALVLDPKDPKKITFGAPVFYLGAMPRARVVFKYADGSVFNLNQGLVLEGRRKTPMLVFDHLAPANPKDQGTTWDFGSDGTQDALKWFDKDFEMRRGFFGLQSNVAVYEESLEKYDPEVQRKKMLQEQARLKQQGIEFAKNRPSGKK